MKPVAEACYRNQEPIADCLATIFNQPMQILEIGSGTGQHAVYIAEKLPDLIWQPTDLAPCLEGIEAWRVDSGLNNIKPAIALDANQNPWPFDTLFDGMFSANTVHFVSWDTVENMLKGINKQMNNNAPCVFYGPYNEDHKFTSDGNEKLDTWLKSRDPESGIKDRADFIDLASKYGLVFQQQHSMPANNQILEFKFVA